MKKLFLFCIIILGGLLSCTSDDDIRYSCDDATDTWIKENLVTIHSLSRRNWMELDGNKQLASYRAFTQEQLIQFWKDKIDEVKKMGWTDAEIAHIDEVEVFIDNHRDFFENKKLTEEESDELELFFYKWQKKGIEQFGWSDRLGKAMFASGNTLVNTMGDILIKKPFPHENCNCSEHSDFCQQLISPCIKVNWCVILDRGCGWLWLAECDGRCMGI